MRKDNRVLCDRLDAAIVSFVNTPEYHALYGKWWGKERSWWTLNASTLPLLANAQGSLLAGDQPLPGGLDYLQDSNRGFQI